MVKSEDMRLLNRREFNELCAALSWFVTSSGVSAFVAATGAASTDTGGPARCPCGPTDPAMRPGDRVLGEGWGGLGKGRRPPADEGEALRTGLSLGMTLIDTAELYGSEEFIGRVIAGQRNRVFLVSKVWPNHVARNGIVRACE